MIHKEVSSVCDRLIDAMDKVKGVLEDSLSMTEDESGMLDDIIGYLESLHLALGMDITALNLIKKG